MELFEIQPVLPEEAKRIRLKSQMARRKGEIALQQEIESQDEWDEMLAKEGLTVVDVYQEWAGPCISMVSNFKRIKNQVSDDLLNFCTAKADRIESLEKYRGKCEPCFLFIAGGSLVNVIRGAKSPLLMSTIVQELEQEHKVIAGEHKRNVIVDEVVETLAEKAVEIKEEETKEVTVAIIKPDVVQEGRADEIIQQMKEDGIEIIAQEEKQLTEEEAREFYGHLSEENFFEDYIQFMTSGISYVLVLSKGRTGKGIIEEWRNKLGPSDVETAKDSAPNSWRAKFGSKGYMNALHGSDCPDSAIRELAFFFPNLNLPTYQKQEKRLERTFALIRPDAYLLHKDEIIEKIKEAGFKIALQKEVQLTKKDAENFYKEHKEEEYFEELTKQMSSGPLLALGLAREDAIDKWRNMLGPSNIDEARENDPSSLRAQFAVPGVQVNMLHGAKSSEEAENEIHRFFPVEQTVAAIKPDAFGTKEEIIKKIHEAGFRIAAQKETTLTPDIIEKFYGNHKEQEYFDELVNYMVSGPTMLMVLSREDAIEGWRSIIGPTDPLQAKEKNPELLRAMYGKDVMHNGLHGSSSSEKVNEIISTLFVGDEITPVEDENEKIEKPETETEEVKAEGTKERTEEVVTEEDEKNTEEVTDKQAEERDAVIAEAVKTEETPEATKTDETPEMTKTNETPETAKTEETLETTRTGELPEVESVDPDPALEANLSSQESVPISTEASETPQLENNDNSSKQSGEGLPENQELLPDEPVTNGTPANEEKAE